MAPPTVTSALSPPTSVTAPAYPPGAPPLPPPPPGVPGVPPPPAHAPGGPAAPSPLGAFLGRTLVGDWKSAVLAAVGPVVAVLVAALLFAVPDYGQSSDNIVVGYTDRMRIALAVLLQGLGGGGVGIKDGTGDGEFSAVSGLADGGDITVSVTPLLTTALWLAALYFGVRRLRARLRSQDAGGPAGAPPPTASGGARPGPRGTAGLEAAVRVGVLLSLAALLLALFAQPSVQGTSVSSSPGLVFLGALLLSLAMACGVLGRDAAEDRLSAHPGLALPLRSLGTALRALAVVVALCGVVTFVVLTQIDDLDKKAGLDGSGIPPLLLAVLLLPNLGAAALGFAWGAPVKGTVSSSGGGLGGADASGTFDFSRLADIADGWAVAGAVALGVVGALTVGVIAARRGAERAGHLLTAAFFLLLFLLLAALGGVGVTSHASFDQYGLDLATKAEAHTSVPDALLFGLLWVFAAVLVAPYALRSARLKQPPPAPAPGAASAPGVPPASGVAPAPGAPPAASATAPAAYPYPPPHTPTQPNQVGQFGPQYPPQYPGQGEILASPGEGGPGGGGGRGPMVWIATIVGALLIGGAAAAGVLLWQDHKDDSDGRGAPSPGHSAGSRQGDGAASDDGAVGTSGGGGDGTSGGGDGAAPAEPSVPTGYHEVEDEKGFSFVIPMYWSRTGVERDSQITYAGATGSDHFLVGVIPEAGYDSYDNFLHMEEIAAAEKSGYRRISLRENTFRGRPGALWEYTYTDDAGQPVHCEDQGYVAENGTEYSILLCGHDDSWQGDLAMTFAVALDSWRLTP
ncbi:hypothetical protein [Streptomyces sp. NPDC050560]|uniref:hypothetical protein n=1 Tax=Streptomyces sp. NPDC050560 TaxID=3365630 RepID=UPI0037B9A34D